VARKIKQDRALLGARFKILLNAAGLKPEAAGKLLHVTPRTIRYWISGKVLVPYAAYKLVRILRLFELPGEGWRGWHMHSGRLWTPEGYGFNPADSDWWGLLVRRADGFGRQYDRANQLAVALRRLAAAGHAMTDKLVPNETAAAGTVGIGLTTTSPEKGGKPVTPSFFPTNGKNCTFFKQSITAFEGVV
jgi:hypothetical protein